MTTLNSRLQLAIVNQKKDRNAIEKGFTLVELLIVVVILGTLSGIALPSLLGQRDKANVSAANSQGRQLMTACQVEGLENAPDYTNTDAAIQTAKTFGKITWTPTVTATGCSAVTTGAATNGSWVFTPADGTVTVTEAG